MKIAFCGAGGSGKTTLVNWISKEVFPELLPETITTDDVVVLGSATRAARDLCGVKLVQEGSDSTQLYSQIIRRLWTFEHQESKVVISERTGLDEIVYQRERFLRLEAELEAKRESLDVSEIESLDATLNLALATLMVLSSVAIEELFTFWDVVYWKRPWSGAPLEDDGVRSTDLVYNTLIDELFEEQISVIRQAMPDKFVLLPDELGEAKSFLIEREFDKWQQLMTRST